MWVKRIFWVTRIWVKRIFLRGYSIENDYFWETRQKRKLLYYSQKRQRKLLVRKSFLLKIGFVLTPTYTIGTTLPILNNVSERIKSTLPRYNSPQSFSCAWYLLMQGV